MVALRCASLALLAIVAVASNDCDADEMDLCDDAAGGGDDSATALCDGVESDLCDYTHEGTTPAATPEPTAPAATPEPTAAAVTPEPTSNACALAVEGLETNGKWSELMASVTAGNYLQFFTSMCEAGAFKTAFDLAKQECAESTDGAALGAIREVEVAQQQIGGCAPCVGAHLQFTGACAAGMADDVDDNAKWTTLCEAGDCKTAIDNAMTICADDANVMPTFGAISQMCDPCMRKFMEVSGTCFSKEGDKMDTQKLCGDACNTATGELEALDCFKEDGGRRLSAEELHTVRSAIAQMVGAGARRLQDANDQHDHDDKDEDPAMMVAMMLKTKNMMCSSCGQAMMPWMSACGLEDKDDEDKKDRRLGSHNKMMCWESCQAATQSVVTECKQDRRLDDHDHEKDDDMDMMDPSNVLASAKKMVALCTPCGEAFMGFNHVEDCDDENADTATGECKDVFCKIKQSCPAAEGLTEAPEAVAAAGIPLDEYIATITKIDALGCGAAATPAPTTADTILTVQYAVDGDFATVVTDKSKFLQECTAALTDGAVCSDVRAGSIIVDITGKKTAADAAVQVIESSADKSLTLPSFGAMKAIGKKATVVATQEAVTKLSEAFPTPAPTAPPTQAQPEDADGARSVYGGLAATAMVITIANIA